ncbi:DUF996 domain-containing protein [Candidatus Bathyarchaeota archaeon]|nr:DUF996 domain-containing protein [Candidatus Bathyarchaeota archaeon]
MSLESNKTLGGIGAILTAIGSVVPIIGIIGIILVLIALKGLAEYYNESLIFQNALYGVIFYVIAVVAAAFVLTVGVFSGILAGASAGSVLLFTGGIILAAVAMFIFYLIGVWFFKRSFDVLSAKSGEKMFNTAGLLLLLGAILTIIVIGLLLMLVAWILAAVAFFSIKTTNAPPPQAQTLPPPPPS